MWSLYLLIMLDTLLLRLALHFTQLHFTPLHFLPFKLHPTTLHYPVIWLNPIIGLTPLMWPYFYWIGLWWLFTLGLKFNLLLYTNRPFQLSSTVSADHPPPRINERLWMYGLCFASVKYPLRFSVEGIRIFYCIYLPVICCTTPLVCQNIICTLWPSPVSALAWT